MNKKVKKNNIFKFPRNVSKVERQVEAILFAASEPLDVESIEKRIQNNSIDVLKTLKKIQIDYQDRGINLVCIKNKWSFRTAEDLSDLMSMQKSTQKKLSKATIETLSIIVYHQPVTRAEIEKIRGKPVFRGTLDILLDLKWIKPQGRRETPGRPVTWVTDYDFLKHFGLNNLNDLPKIEELESLKVE